MRFVELLMVVVLIGVGVALVVAAARARTSRLYRVTVREVDAEHSGVFLVRDGGAYPDQPAEAILVHKYETEDSLEREVGMNDARRMKRELER